MAIKNKLMLNVAILLATILISLLFMEIALRISYPIYKDYNTEMWRYSSDIKIPSKNKFVSHEHAAYKSGFYYGTTITTNADGFRDYNYSVKKNPSTYRILMLGDSITLGWGVEFDDISPKLIEKKLNSMGRGKKFEVINTGIGNYNTQMEVELLKDKGIKYNPDLVILNYYINDAELTKKSNLMLYHLQRNSYLYAFLWDKLSNVFLKLGNKDYANFYSNLYEDSFEGKKVMLKYIDELAEISKKNNIKLLIVIYPEFHNFRNYNFTYVTDLIRNASQKNNALFLDLLPYYENVAPEKIWISFEDVHPNALGNSIAANAITDFLIKKNLVPLSS